MALTAKQKHYCHEFLLHNSAKEAAIRAGYHSGVAPRGKEVKEYIAKLQAERAQRTQITADRVLEEIAKLAFSDIADFLTVEPGGAVVLKAFEEMKKGKTRVIKTVKEKRTTKASSQGDGEEILINSQLEYTMHDKIKALELAAKHVGLIGDRKTDEESEEPPGFIIQQDVS